MSVCISCKFQPPFKLLYPSISPPRLVARGERPGGPLSPVAVVGSVMCARSQQRFRLDVWPGLLPIQVVSEVLHSVLPVAGVADLLVAAAG